MPKAVPVVPYCLFLILAAALFAPIARGESEGTPVSCVSADSLNLVAGGADCFAIMTFGAAGPASGGILLAFLHGDLSSGGPGDSFREVAESMAGPGVTSVVLVRQGYSDSRGRRSTGSNFGRSDNATARNVDAIAEALSGLKAFHHASRLVVIGHSRGSNIAGVLLGRRPGLIDAALLFSCPCDLQAREVLRQRRPGGYRSLSPIDTAGAIPADAWIATVTGSRDDNTMHQGLIGWHEALNRRGIRLRDLVLDGEGHNWRRSWFRNPEVRDLIDKALAGGR